ncbi:MAG: hypothetical protein AAFZ58_04325 [Pseudomonadota bacterium]
MSVLSHTVRRYARDVNELHHEYLVDPLLAERFERFLQWQAAYLLQQHGDFAARAEYTDAVEFVVNDLTGFDVSDRDRDLARIVPLMSRVLPDSVLATLAGALELNAGALAMNLAICRELYCEGDVHAFSERRYAAAVRVATDRDRARELVLAIRGVGEDLERIVELPMIGKTLSSMRLPAELMGFGALHRFLAKGFTTFRDLPDTPRFLDELEARMLAIYHRLYDASLDELAD